MQQRHRAAFMAIWTAGLGILLLLSGGCTGEQDHDTVWPSDHPADPQAFYAAHSHATDPAEYAYLYEGVPVAVDSIVQIVQGVLIPYDQYERQDLGISHRRADRDIHTRTVRGMLKRLSARKDLPLVSRRIATERMVGICTHFALLTCSLLRHHGIPARARHGFETYVAPRAHHNHTICEYWDTTGGQWLRVDAEIGEYFADRFEVDFDPCVLPASAFVDGAATWVHCRLGETTPAHFGIAGEGWLGGWDFVLGTAIHDILALNKVELLPWQDNAVIKRGYRRMLSRDRLLMDHLAELAAGGDSFHHALRELSERERTWLY